MKEDLIKRISKCEDYYLISVIYSIVLGYQKAIEKKVIK